MKRFIVSTFALGIILSMVVSVQGVNVNTTEEAIVCLNMDNADTEDWVTIKENVRAINFEKGESMRVDIVRNTITGKLFATRDHFFGAEISSSDRSGYKYCFEWRYQGTYYFNL